MKLSLRDFFWLALAVASLAAWAIEHRQATEDLRAWRMHSWFARRGFPSPTETDRRRLAAVRRFRQFSDEQLAGRLMVLTKNRNYLSDLEYEPCLLEMARRGMSAALQSHYDALQAGSTPGTAYSSFSFRNLSLLTALRRAQQQADPLQIDVVVGDVPKLGTRAPLIYATRTNVDAGQESIGLVTTDGYLWRNGHWFVTLADEKGQQVTRSDYLSMNGGGLHGLTALPHGAKVGNSTELDLRRYIAPPKSGKYQLQALYHNELNIADQQDLTGLVVSKSDAIWVTVHNPNDRASQRWIRAPHPALAILAACGLLTGMSLVRPLSISGKIPRRDLVWTALLVAIATSFWLDSLYRSSRIHRLIPDADARWTIEPAERPVR